MTSTALKKEPSALRTSHTGPICRDANNSLSWLLPSLHLDTVGAVFKLKRDLTSPVLTVDNVEYVALAWLTTDGLMAANAKLAAATIDGVLIPVLDVYRVARIDQEIHVEDTWLAADAAAVLTEEKVNNMRVYMELGGAWVYIKDLPKEAKAAAVQVAEDGASNWGVMVAEYNGGRYVFTGTRRIRYPDGVPREDVRVTDILSLGPLRVVLPW